MYCIAGGVVLFVSSRRRHTRCALVTGVQTCALPISNTARMSVTSFHRNFLAATSMSPIQYQKHIRLHAARSRLLAGDGHSIADISFSVGFNSPSQFSREYRRLFGQPPSDDIKNAGT